MKLEEEIRFAFFCIEVAQAGISLMPKDLQAVYNAALKLEGFKPEDFKNANHQTYTQQAQRMLAALDKRKQVTEAILFNMIAREGIEGLDTDDAIERLGKAKRVAAIMADEFLSPDEKLEKVVEDGRRLIESFIDQWKALPHIEPAPTSPFPNHSSEKVKKDDDLELVDAEEVP